MTAERRFFFVHLQKTAGTALWRRLQTQFSPAEVYPGPGDGNPPDATLVVADLLQRWKVRRDEIKIVTGHFPFCTAELLGEEFRTLTTLRNPVDRVLSSLRNQHQKVEEQAALNLQEIYHQPLRHVILRNHMVKMFALSTDEMTAGALTEVELTRSHLERAKENLERVEVVGLQENFEGFCSELSKRFGWDLGEPLMMNRTQPMEIDESLREMLAEDNALDVEFYEFAEQLCATRDH
ncbi:MAG: hypothetical protein IH940_02535 [Acidobacteria bacterium]|nr:hypothetical protein [Acidobacteriota bacterium]